MNECNCLRSGPIRTCVHSMIVPWPETYLPEAQPSHRRGTLSGLAGPTGPPCSSSGSSWSCAGRGSARSLLYRPLESWGGCTARWTAAQLWRRRKDNNEMPSTNRTISKRNQQHDHSLLNSYFASLIPKPLRHEPTSVSDHQVHSLSPLWSEWGECPHLPIYVQTPVMSSLIFQVNFSNYIKSRCVILLKRDGTFTHLNI